MPGFDAVDDAPHYHGSQPDGMRIAHLSAYPPRECELATYCEELLTATLTAAGVGEPMVVAMENQVGHYDYPWPVIGTVDDRDDSEYEAAAQFLNDAPADIVSIQHEPGIYGGSECNGLSYFLEELTKPVVTTLHAVLPSPSPAQRAMVQELGRRSERLVVFSGFADELLQHEYRIDHHKTALIHHGAPAPSGEPRDVVKARLGLSGRRVLSTFGLVSRCLEYVIGALPEIKKRHPDICYVIAGETYPDVQRTHKQTYREELERLVKTGHLTDSVIFLNRSLTKAETVSYLAATDIYLTPYPNPHWISSGALAYAVAAGKAVVATPCSYARFLLRDGRGTLVEFADRAAIADAVCSILDDLSLQRSFENKCRTYGKRMLWPAVAARYVSVFRDVLRKQGDLEEEDATYTQFQAEYDYVPQRGSL